MEADGKEHIEKGSSAAANDLYGDGERISHMTFPSTRANSGDNSCATVCDVRTLPSGQREAGVRRNAPLAGDARPARPGPPGESRDASGRQRRWWSGSGNEPVRSRRSDSVRTPQELLADGVVRAALTVAAAAGAHGMAGVEDLVLPILFDPFRVTFDDLIDLRVPTPQIDFREHPGAARDRQR